MIERSVDQSLRKVHMDIKGLISKAPSKVMIKFLNTPKFCMKYSMITVLHTVIGHLYATFSTDLIHIAVLHLLLCDVLLI